MKTLGDITFFFGAQDPLSNWHPARFVVKTVPFGCAEQYMMYAKACLFGDREVAAQILAAPTPKEQKQLGRKVCGYDEAIWAARRERIVFAGLLEKFRQNPRLDRCLLATGTTMLAEASPYDRIWGIGLSVNDPRISAPSFWPGQNLLGKVLMEVRSVLRDQN